MPKFLVSVPVLLHLEKIVEVDSKEEIDIESFEPDEFENFDFIYETIGSNWRKYIQKAEIEEIQKA